MASATEERHLHLQDLVRHCLFSPNESGFDVGVVTICALQQKEVDFLHNENQLLEGYLQRVRRMRSGLEHFGCFAKYSS